MVKITKIPILTESEIKENLKDTPLWKYEKDRLCREFKFNDYKESINFIDILTDIFEEMDHHPDIKIKYSKVVFELNTHLANDKVTEIDFILAQEIDRVFEENFN